MRNGNAHELLTKIQARDPDTLETIVRTYLPQLVRAARAAGLSSHEADDIAQSTFITFIEKAATFEGRSQIRTWLFGILYRKIMESRRATGRDADVDDIDAVMESRFDARGSWSGSPRQPDAELFARQVGAGIDECLQRVPSRQRIAFVLREVEGMSTADISQILEVTDTHVGVLLFRARNGLRECLQAKGVRA